MSYSNNHTHLHKYKGEYYILSHALTLQNSMDINGGFRSLCADNIEVNERKLEITLRGASMVGAEQIETLNPYYAHTGTEAASTADIWYVQSEGGINKLSAISEAEGSWILLKGVKFEETSKFLASVKGTGRIEIRLDSKSADAAAAIQFDNSELKTVYTDSVNIPEGTHDMYIVFSSSDIILDAWEFK